MPKKTPATQRALACPDCAADAFAISLLKDDGVGVAKCAGCARDYLLFDSGDYWFDVIQQRYPRERRCACTGATFRLRGDYRYGDDGEIHAVQLWSTCTQCAKTRREMTLDIDYAPTAELAQRPLVFCAKPKLLYDLRQLTMLALPEHIGGLVRFLETQEHCTFFGKLREPGRWDCRLLEGPAAIATVLARKAADGLDSYLWLYALPTAIDVPPEAVATARAERSFWQRNEVIRIGAPVSMGALMYYVEFANERVDGEAVLPKSEAFRAATGRMLQWLGQEFVSWSGASSFDDPVEHERHFGDRFTRAAKR